MFCNCGVLGIVSVYLYCGVIMVMVMLKLLVYSVLLVLVYFVGVSLIVVCC